MKIAFINIYQSENNRGGAEVFVTEVVKRLSINHEVTLFAGDRIPNEKRWPVLWRFFLDPQGMQIAFFTIRLIPKIIRGRFQIIIPLNGGWQPAILRIVTWICGGKLIISGQSGIGWDDRNNLWCFPDTFVALTESAKAWANRANPWIRSIVIPNGVNLDEFSPKGKKYKLALPSPIVLSVGGFTQQKRLRLVIQAVSRLDKVSLALVGGRGDLKDELQKEGNKLLPGRFQILTVAHKEISDVYRAADVFALVSATSESFGIVYLEALATGLSVVGPDDPQRREILGKDGIYVSDPENIDELCGAIKKALNMKKKSGTTVASKFSWDRIAIEYEELFERLLI